MPTPVKVSCFPRSEHFYVATHNGRFHPDDVLACTLILLISPTPLDVVRTRDPKIIREAAYVVDVGSVNNPAKNRYDHHMQNVPQGPKGPRSAAGLVWSDNSEAIIRALNPKISPKIIPEIQEMITTRWIDPIDAHDNGRKHKGRAPCETAIMSLNPTFPGNVPESEADEIRNEDFSFAISLVKRLLRRDLDRMISEIAIRRQVATANEKTDSDNILHLENYPTNISDFSASQAEFIVIEKRLTPRKSEWQALCVPPVGQPMRQKMPFPAEWRGLEDEALQKITGLADARYVHHSSFLAIAKTEAGIRRMIEMTHEMQSSSQQP